MTSTRIGPVTSTATWDLRAPGVDEPVAVTVASASHAGDQDRNADVVAVHHFESAGTVAAALFDGRGTSIETVEEMGVCAAAAVRIAARHGAENGVLTAGSMLADPTREFAPRDGVGVLAVVRPGSLIKVVHVGRARAYAWADGELDELTEDLTYGQQLRAQGRTEQEAAAYDRLQRVTLARSVLSSVPTTLTDRKLVLLTTHGVYRVLGRDGMATHVRAHEHDGADVLADRILDAALQRGEPGARANATVVVIALRPGQTAV